MHGDDRRQTAFNLCERFIPCCLDKAAVSFDQRFAQAVRIFMQVFEGNRFGTKIATAEDVSCMAANAFHPVFGHGDFKAAASFTERADPVVDCFLYEDLLFVDHGPSW